MRAFHVTHIVALLLALLVTSAPAQEQRDRPQRQDAQSGIFSLIPPDSVTEHSLRFGIKTLPYSATMGTLDVFGQNGERSAKIFYTAYVANDRPIDRPLTFVFNGGPGAASAYLHLGLVGPRILEFGPRQDDGTRPLLTDNPDSWLAFTDLVLIDPVGTGWSRAASNEDAKSFYGVRQDAESLAKIVALYTQKNGRLPSPKYLVGESYGGFRAAKVASALKDTQGILVSGIIMISPMIEGRFLWGADEDPLTAALRLPSLAAAALERKNAFDPTLVEEAERFAMSDYLVSLAGPSPRGLPLMRCMRASRHLRVSRSRRFRERAASSVTFTQSSQQAPAGSSVPMTRRILLSTPIPTRPQAGMMIRSLTVIPGPTPLPSSLTRATNSASKRI